jgi:NitT/TauT family transport system permease protein
VKNRLWFVGLGLVIVIWVIAAQALSSLLLPGPLPVFHRVLTLVRSVGFLSDAGWTLLRVAAGVSAGFGLGLLIAVVLAHSRLARSLLDPVLQLLRPVSPFAWTPLVILLFGLGSRPAIAVIFIGVLFPAIVIAFEALRSIDPELLDIAHIFGVSGWSRIVEVELPLVAPELLAALRILFGVGWIMAIGAEMLAANSGLGYRLMNARYLLDFPSLYSLILIVGIIGYGLDFGLRRFERLTARR